MIKRFNDTVEIIKIILKGKSHFNVKLFEIFEGLVEFIL